MIQLKLYETRHSDGRKTWWTQRNKKGNCFEIEERGLFTKIYIVRVNEIQQEICDDLRTAETALRKYERLYS